jgi:hypothetical protein
MRHVPCAAVFPPGTSEDFAHFLLPRVPLVPLVPLLSLLLLQGPVYCLYCCCCCCCCHRPILPGQHIHLIATVVLVVLVAMGWRAKEGGAAVALAFYRDHCHRHCHPTRHAQRNCYAQWQHQRCFPSGVLQLAPPVKVLLLLFLVLLVRWRAMPLLSQRRCRWVRGLLLFRTFHSCSNTLGPLQRAGARVQRGVGGGGRVSFMAFPSLPPAHTPPPPPPPSHSYGTNERCEVDPTGPCLHSLCTTGSSVTARFQQCKHTYNPNIPDAPTHTFSRRDCGCASVAGASSAAVQREIMQGMQATGAGGCTVFKASDGAHLVTICPPPRCQTSGIEHFNAVALVLVHQPGVTSTACVPPSGPNLYGSLLWWWLLR